MKNVNRIQFYVGSKEEVLPGAFFMEGGCLEYDTPKGRIRFPAGSSSYFGKVFRKYAQCTPSEFRKKWQDCDR